MKRWHSLALAAVLLTQAGCSGENYRTLYEADASLFNEMIDYLTLVVDEDSAKVFNEFHFKKIKNKVETIATKLEGWEKLYSADKDSMRPYLEMKILLEVCRKFQIKEIPLEDLQGIGQGEKMVNPATKKMEDTKGLSEATFIFRLLRDDWANTKRYYEQLNRIGTVRARSVARLQKEYDDQKKNEIVTGPKHFPELEKLAPTNPKQASAAEPSKLNCMIQPQTGFAGGQLMMAPDAVRDRLPTNVRQHVPKKEKQP